ncbi:MAG: glutamate 5-kinase [Selenomonadaceae bacterium]|nr:glutamate 5-kinase [Selenomonadaceae bacterium]
MTARDRLRETKRLVVKVGTSTLTYPTGRVNLERMEHLARELADLSNRGLEVVLVTSAAIAVGLEKIGLREKPAEIPKKQAVAAIGQGMLMHLYEKIFSGYGKTIAQVLLTQENSRRHHQYIHSRNALLALLDMGVIPIINENDAVSVDEIKIGDNDTLSAMVATLVDADGLIILSDIDGLYSANPQTAPNAELMAEVREITPEIEKIAGGAGSKLGTGGMGTKIAAAKIAMNAGVTMVIAPGHRERVLHDLLAGENIGTIFPAKEAHLKVRKSWLAFGKGLSGDIKVDAGCAEAMLKRGASLLAAGITSLEGEFTAGSTVRVLDPEEREIARGIVHYDADTLKRLIGKKTAEFPELVTGNIRDEVIHRDNLVLMV